MHFFSNVHIFSLHSSCKANLRNLLFREFEIMCSHSRSCSLFLLQKSQNFVLYSGEFYKFHSQNVFLSRRNFYKALIICRETRWWFFLLSLEKCMQSMFLLVPVIHYVRIILIYADRHSLKMSRSPFCWHRYTYISAWISNYMASKVWGEITYPLLNFNGHIVEDGQVTQSYTFIMYVNTYRCWN